MNAHRKAFPKNRKSQISEKIYRWIYTVTN